MKSSDKSPAMRESLENISKALFGTSREESIGADTCVICGHEATEFDGELSRKEFAISGMCQECQDDVFG